MSFANEDEHREALKRLFRPRPEVYGPPAPSTPPTTRADASAILARLRGKPTVNAFDPLHIIDTGEQSLGFGRFRFARSFWVEFNREPLIAEIKSMEDWAARSCERGFRLNGVTALLYNSTDWNLFITSYK